MIDSTPVIGRVWVLKVEPGHYGYEISCDGQVQLVDGGFSSIVAAIESGADITGPITALEVAYGGVVAGSYTLQRLSADADAIAKHAVETFAAVMS